MTEEDTFRRLSRCTYEELREKIGGGNTAKSILYLPREQRDKIIIDNHWTIEEWRAELRNRLSRNYKCTSHW